MTKEEWLAIEVGDFIIERSSGNKREVVSVRRVSGRRGQPKGYTRTIIHVPRIHDGPWRSKYVTIQSSEDTRGERFTLEKRRDQ